MANFNASGRAVSGAVSLLSKSGISLTKSGGVIGKTLQVIKHGQIVQPRHIQTTSQLFQNYYDGDMTVRGVELLRDPRTNKVRIDEGVRMK